MIRDWWTAQEFDVQAALYIKGELDKQALEREKRDRVFFIKLLGSEVPEGLEPETEPEITISEVLTEDQALAASPLARGY